MGCSKRGLRRAAGALGLALWLPLCAWAQGGGEAEAPERPADTVRQRLASADPVERYDTALEQIDALGVYNEQMRELIAAQQAELTSLNEQVAQVEIVKRSIPEVLIKMVDALDEFVKLDLPFKVEERQEAVAELRSHLRNAEMSDADRYRAIMDIYMVENEYGRTVDAYQATLKKDGQETPVAFLRIGRIALIYQTLDESEAGIWDEASRSWVELDDSYTSSIRQALRIARKQAAPDLVNLPLPAAQPAGS